jgi:deferrochelatase/peroxidase EfeB
MNLRRWDSATVREQERTIGRRRDSGAPLTGRHEHDVPNFSARDDSGGPVIPAHAHIRLAHRDFNGGIEIVRRSYSYDAGVTELPPLSDKAPSSDAHGFDAGLAFIAFMREPQQFIRLQTRLASHDNLNVYIRHVGSGLFVVPPGAAAGGYVGDTLLG